VPTLVGTGGRIATYEIDLWPKEVQALKRSASVLGQTLSEVLKRVSAKV